MHRTLILLIIGLFARQALADTTYYCDDYFRTEWNTRLDMTSADSGVLHDIPDLELGPTGTLGYGSGSLSFTSASSSPLVTLLQYTVPGSIPDGTRYGALHRIDTSKYHYFTVRMYASQAATAQLIWYFANTHYATTTFPVYAGWRTYSIYLPSATAGSPSSGSPLAWTTTSVEGLSFVPVNAAGIDVGIDWIQLTDKDCSSYDANFAGTGGAGLKRIAMLDDNTSPTDGVFAATSASTSNTHSFSRHMLFPGEYNMYGIESGDWHVLNFYRGWDMTSANDIWTLYQSGISGAGFSSGRFYGNTSADDPSFYLLMPSGYTVDNSTYRYLTMGIEFSMSGSDNGAVHVFPQSGGVQSFFYAASNGYHIYTFDLASVTGPISNIRIDPTDHSGDSFSLDFVAVRSDAYLGAEQSVSTTNLGTLSVADLALDFVQPDRRGGVDYAQSVLGNSWNMNAKNDIVRVENVDNAYFYPNNTFTDEAGVTQTGDFYKLTNILGNGDPINYSAFVTGGIDTSKFVNFCFRGWNKNQDPVYNSVARLIWQDPRSQEASSFKNGDDIVMARGAKEYCLDLTDRTYAQTEPPWGESDPNPWTDIGAALGGVTFFRLDMNEDSTAGYYSVIDYIHLREDHYANTQFAIALDAPLGQAVSLYYNSSKSTSGGTLITNLSSGRNSNLYLWDTSALAEGVYYIYGSSSANGNTLSRLAGGRIHVSHSRSQDSTAPVLSCERPYDGYEFDSSLELAGFALDETRTALVEVFTSDDGSSYDYFTTITPDKFHLGARDAYVNYAESNNPGFQIFPSATSLPYGTLYVKIIATDTAGNQSNCIKSVVRRNGASTAPLTYPAADASPIAADINVGAGEDFAFSAKIASKNVARYTVTGCSGQADIYAQISKKLLTSKPTKLGSTSSTADSANLPKLKAGQKKIIYLKATCGETTSSVKQLKVSNIKNKKAKGTLSQILKKMLKNFR